MDKQKHCILAIDQGTFSSRATIFNELGETIQNARQSIALTRKNNQHIEQDAEEILQSVRHVIESVLNSNAAKKLSIISAGLATQRSSILAWKPSCGVAISPVLSWQDTRAVNWLSKFKDKQEFIQNKTGLRLSPHYGVSKMRWLLDNNKNVKQAVKKNDCVITPIASYLLFNLTDNKNINIDIANASRSLMCNLLKRDWDNELLKIFEVRKENLAQCLPVNSDYGTISNTAIEITAVNGDQTSALYSNGMPEQKTLKVNLGTGAFVLTPISIEKINTTEFKNSGLLAGVSFSTEGQADYYIEGTVNGAGSALKWLQQQLPEQELTELLKKSLEKIEPGIFINSVGGFGSPVWRSDISPHFLEQLDIKKKPEQAVVSILESIVFLLMLNIERIRVLKNEIEKIEISGGLSNSNFLCQRLANLSSLKLHRAEEREATSRGIAWLVSKNKKLWKTLPAEKIFYPENDDSLKGRFQAFKSHLKQAYEIE